MVPTPIIPRPYDPPRVQAKALADLLDWLTDNRLTTLVRAGFTTEEIFLLRRVSIAYRFDRVRPEHLRNLYRLTDKLEDVYLAGW